ncbi:hypothetical protein ISN45_Aa08g026510 [Arabidopsis thaliana x Arabidopsis arenosa]|uniref:DUF7610 domain-containing protein n=1 Tax=Arabidopsis thaliana x Arabidopsis arenosa TaxID=1240361 RepID=A0A8T1XSA6_9BRAS|nr:hypothetical protein ISN45_Aa08g026510 [Arabidopsis thaliana x Arabidopsis arenosa]
MKTTKAKANTILEKKLEELECLLQEFGSGNGDLNAYREFELRFLFTHTLLSAEVSSVKDDEEEEEMLKLRCMAKRLTELEEAFKELTSSINQPDMQGLESGGGVVNVDETGLVRSLVESLHEEYQDASLEEKLARRKTEKMKKKRFRGLVSFGIVGFVAGMVSFYGYLYDQMNEKTIFLTPT